MAYHYDVYREEDLDCLVSIIRAFPLGLIVTCSGEEFAASHIPFMVSSEYSEAPKLLGHMDQSNPQIELLEGNPVYVVFSGPNAYVSPTVYATRQLPTWNYISVHVTGHARVENPGSDILEDIEHLTWQLEPTIGGWTFDKTENRVQQLSALIRRVTVVVDHIEGRVKMSQEKGLTDRIAATRHLLNYSPQKYHWLVEKLGGIASKKRGG